MSVSGPLIVLDVSRLLSRAGRTAPTGIDRVELAYVEHFIAERAPLSFTAVNAAGRIGLLARSQTEAYISGLAKLWRHDTVPAGYSRRLKRLALRLRMGSLLHGERALRAQLRASIAPPIYLLVSHYRLEAHRAISRVKSYGGCRFVCLIHDLIPIQFPEYAKPGQDERHRRRIETAAELSDAIIVASNATADALEPYLKRAGRAPPVLVAPFGWRLPAVARHHEVNSRPYFVYLGTIEGRKNHILLLNLWRQLAANLGREAPQLILIGRRGTLAQGAVDMLERCPALRGLVIERKAPPDAEMAQLLRDARALLLPSFAEGFGFPLIEALALGVPALCSDLRALRETGGEVPEFIDPLDGAGWREAILDYAASRSPRREAQLHRLKAWRPTLWEEHFAAVHALLADITGERPQPKVA